MKKLFFLMALAMMSVMAYAQRPIITKWNATDGIIKLRIIGASSYTYQKTTDATVTGSGTMASGLNTITLPSAGVYNLSITPNNSFRFVFNNAGLTPTDIAKFVELSQWGDIKWNTNLSELFYGCSNLQITATDIPDFSKVTDMSSMFGNCSSITDIPNINQWNVGQVTTMAGMFSNAIKFNSPIGNWNVSNVTDMHYFFERASNFNQDLNNWNVKNVTTMYAMFRGANSFNGNIADWDVSSVQYMQGMFTDCKNFNRPIEKWNVSNVLVMNGMFQSAVKFNQSIGDWDVSKVTQMIWMFDGAISFNQPINNWNVSAVQYTDLMFNNATSFNQDLSKWNIRATSLLHMFDNSGLDCQNYSSTLYGWSKNSNTPSNVSLGAQNIIYGQAAKPYRDALIAKGWTITGDYLDPDCNATLAAKEAKLSGKSLQVYPNPTSGLFKIKTTAAEVATLYDYSGRLLKTQKLSAGENTMDISNLQNGVYLIKVGNDTSKIIKK